MITDMDNWTNIRRDVLVDGMSRREACKKYNLNFRTIQKILSHVEPPGYCQTTARDKPKIGLFIPIIHEILEADKKVHRKQRRRATPDENRLDRYRNPVGGSLDLLKKPFSERLLAVLAVLSCPDKRLRYRFRSPRPSVRGHRARP